MSLSGIKQLLREKMGLNAEKIGDSSVKHAVENRLLQHAEMDLASYLKLVQESRAELYALIEEVVVSETWFFRNTKPFFACAAKVKAIQQAALGQLRPVEILSLPCSTGEEPYSIAIALREALLDTSKIAITAVDISQQAINQAKRGLFSKNSLREVPEPLLAKYFTPRDGRFAVSDEIRRMVTFTQGNLLVGPASPRPDFYDVIFCRNLLIYLDAELHAQSVEKLFRALRPDGVLYVGHAETMHLGNRWFQATGERANFGFTRISPRAQPKPLLNGKNTVDTGPNAIAGSKPSPTDASTSPSMVANHIVANHNVVPKQKVISITFLKSLVDKEQFEKAEPLIVEFLRTEPNNTEVLYLRGWVRFRLGDDKQAMSVLKKLLSMAPEHTATLALLGKIAEKNYDLDAVRLYKEKLERLRRLRRN